MGYSHSWGWKTPQADENKFASWSKDVQQLIDYLTTPDRDLPGYIYHYYHCPPDRADHPYKIYGMYGTGEPVITSTVVAFNGDVNLGEQHDCFMIELQDLKAANYLGFCKTAALPYDLLVITSLVRFAHYFPTTYIRSDGEEEAIIMGLTICRKIFGESNMPLLLE